MIFVLFSLGMALIFTLANFYSYKRFVGKISFCQPFKKLFLSIFFLLSLIQAFFIIFRSSEYLGDFWYGLLAISFAPTYCLFFAALLFDALKFFLKLLGKDYKECALFGRFFLELVLVFAAIFATYESVGGALKIPQVKTVDLHLENLEQNLSIALLADIHLGKNLHEDFLSGLITKVNEQKADLIVIVGDLVDTDPKNLSYISKLNQLRSKYGTFYVLGNHEYYHGVNAVLELLRKKTNMQILVNESRDLGFINIAGLADLTGLKKGVLAPDLARVRADLNASKPSILLAHQPKTVLLYDVSDFDLILSGHTHGGQIFPFGLLVKLQQGFVSGLYELGEKTRLFVSTGAGFWGPSFRTFAQSEIVILNLKGQQ
ncbi:metallophosphoesterase [Campylobacter sp.]|uniref:metallophosphoesterase n=1 Tax=Campylobacter sp. TaxID=205 RepID=UPI0026DC6487|nr:metallophosphoesterase [Campylobacter sp.]MDO4673942.1 metallophosphoesterase [Campylobacter sp.]